MDSVRNSSFYTNFVENSMILVARSFNVHCSLFINAYSLQLMMMEKWTNRLFIFINFVPVCWHPIVWKRTRKIHGNWRSKWMGLATKTFVDDDDQDLLPMITLNMNMIWNSRIAGASKSSWSNWIFSSSSFSFQIAAIPISNIQYCSAPNWTQSLVVRSSGVRLLLKWSVHFDKGWCVPRESRDICNFIYE